MRPLPLEHPVRGSVLPAAPLDPDDEEADADASAPPRLDAIAAGFPGALRGRVRELLQAARPGALRILRAMLDNEDDGRRRALLDMAGRYLRARPRPRDRSLGKLQKAEPGRGLVELPIYEIPVWMGRVLWTRQQLDLFKGRSHKYIRKVPDGHGGWRYFYTVAGGHGLGSHEEFQVGAAFKLADQGHRGHFHITEIGPDGKITVKHDESEREEKLEPAVLSEMLRNEHATAIAEHARRLGGEIEGARAHGTPRQVARLEAEAGRYGHTSHLVTPPAPPHSPGQGMVPGNRAERIARARAAGAAVTEPQHGSVTGAHIAGALGEGHRRGAGATVQLQDAPEVAKLSTRVFGRALEPHEVAALVGAGEGDRLFVRPDRGTLLIKVRGDGWGATRRVFLDGDVRTMHQSKFKMEKTGSGQGTDIFASQVANASALGIREFQCIAEFGGGYNGAYTWARLGYVPAPEERSPVARAWNTSVAAQRALQQAGFDQSTTLQELVASPRGREIWLHHAVPFEAVFDLSPNSYSMRTLHAYLQSRGRGTR